MLECHAAAQLALALALAAGVAAVGLADLVGLDLADGAVVGAALADGAANDQ